MIIDTETHVIKKVAFAVLAPENPLCDPLTWIEHSGDLLVQNMNVAGVDKAICASYDLDDVTWELSLFTHEPWIGPVDFQGGAKYTYEFIKKYPDRLIWFDTVNPSEEGTVQWITDKAKMGLKGVKWLPAACGKGSSVDGPKAQEMLQACVKLKFPLVISFEDVVPGAPATPDQFLKQMNNAADRFPELKMALYHAGYGIPNMLPKEGTTEMVKRHDNLYMSTSLYFIDGGKFGPGEYPWKDYLAAIKELSERVGVERMMWSTDWPWTEFMCKYRQTVMAVKNHATFLNEKQKERFMAGTAQEFLGL